MRRGFLLASMAVAVLLIAGAPDHAFAAQRPVAVAATHDAPAAIRQQVNTPPELEKNASEPGLPQLDPALWPGQAFWLVISFGLTYLLMRYLALPQVERALARREGKLEEDIEHAKLANEHAKQLAGELDLRMNDARTRAADAVRDALAESGKKLAAALAQQQKTLDEDLKSAEAKLNAQKQKVIASLDEEAVPMVEAILKRLTGAAPANDVVKAAWQKAKA